MTSRTLANVTLANVTLAKSLVGEITAIRSVVKSSSRNGLKKYYKVGQESLGNNSFKSFRGKISAQPHTSLCIQFLNRENND